MRVKQILLMSVLLLCVGCASGRVVNSIGMEFQRISGGTFKMGSPSGEDGRGEDETGHEVTITKSYILGVHEVTQEQYAKVMGTNPSYFKFSETFPRIEEDGSTTQVYAGNVAKKPVESVKFYSAVAFCQQLSSLSGEKAAGRKYRLPTEAEWEYACRAGAQTRFFWGEEPKKGSEHMHPEVQDGIAWRGPREVGTRKPNYWGLHDMLGNVAEWCSDWYGPYPAKAASDPRGPSRGERKVVKGGSWSSDPAGGRCGARASRKPRLDADFIGFRVVLFYEK